MVINVQSIHDARSEKHKIFEGGHFETRQVTKIYVQCKNADTFVPFYITPKHVHLTGKKCGHLGYYAAISCNYLPTCIG